MKPSELRLGNLISRIIPTKGIERVHLLTLAHSDDFFKSIFEGIPLNYTWLERMGFTVVKGKNAHIQVDDDVFVIFETEVWWTFNDGNYPFMFVHEIQNLFHAVTGHELEIHLPS